MRRYCKRVDIEDEGFCLAAVRDFLRGKSGRREVQALLDSGLPRDATALQAIGYKQFLAVADGAATADQAVEEVKLRSRQYAKRQLTWLRRNPAIHWIYWDKEPDFPAALQNATDFLTAHGLG